MEKLFGVAVILSVLFFSSIAKGEEFFPEERDASVIGVYQQIAQAMAKLKCPSLEGDSKLIKKALEKTLNGRVFSEQWLSEMGRLVSSLSEGKVYLEPTEDPSFPSSSPHGHLLVLSKNDSRRYVISPKAAGIFCEEMGASIRLPLYSFIK